MLFKPSIGRLRVLARDAARHRPPSIISRRPLHLSSRSSCTGATSNTVRVMRIAAIKRGVSTAARSKMSSFTASNALKSWARNVAATLRSSVGRSGVQYARLNRLFARFPAQIFKSSTSGSQILRGALSAFKNVPSGPSAVSASRSAYARLGSPFVTFARGATSGLGARPAFGSLTLSPLRGGLGLQSARKFSSGGARIFDNLIVNAPLALRLVGDEAEQKAKLLARTPTRGPRRATPAGPSRTGATFSTANVARNALLFSTQQKARKPATASVPTTEAILEEREEALFTAAQKQKAIETDLNTYFELPALSLPHGKASTTMTIRLVDPLHEALGGRDPLPFDVSRGGFGATLFDAPLSMDVDAVMEYEQQRYMQAKALLRVLWDQKLLGLHGSMDLFSDPEQWRVSLDGIEAAAVRKVLDEQLPFDYRPWVSFDGEPYPASTPRSLASTPPSSNSPSTSVTSTESSALDDDSTSTSTSFNYDLSPPVSTSSLSSHDDEPMLVFHLPPPSESSLFDSREFA